MPHGSRTIPLLGAAAAFSALALILSARAAADAGQTAGQAAVSSELRSQIASAYHEMDAAFSRKDLDSYIAFLSADFVDEKGDAPAGKDEKRRAVAEMFARPVTLTMESEILRFDATAGRASVLALRTLAMHADSEAVAHLPPEALHAVDVSQETWVAAAGGWRLARREPTPLQKELAAMVREDQERRRLLLENPGNSELEKRVEEIDERNTARMREILRGSGWPGNRSVGDAGSHDAWLLIQHADADTALQAEALDLMRAARARGEVSGSDFAYLTDRVLIARGKKQIYATQFAANAQGKLVPLPIENEAGVDARRKSMGLLPLDEYRRLVEEMYGRAAPADSGGR